MFAFAVMCWAPGCGDDSGQTADAPPGSADAAIDATLEFDAANGSVCGGDTGLTCPGSQFCDFPDNGCGAADGTGVCVDRPTGCPDPIAQAFCGCDGTVYADECEANLAGTDLNRYGTCPQQTGDSFSCGWLQCDKLTQYCQHTVPGVPDALDGFSCVAMPACASEHPTCGCLIDEPCGSMCDGDFTSGLTVTCAGV